MFLKKSKIKYLKSAIAYLGATSRRRVCSRSKLLQTPCNTEDAVKGAIPKGTNFKFFYFHASNMRHHKTYTLYANSII